MNVDELRHELADGMDGGAQLGRVVPLLGALIADVQPADLRLPTPCDGWTVHDLLNHVIGGAGMFADAFAGAPVRDISGRLPDALGDSPLAAFEAAVTRFGEAAAQPGAMQRVLPLPWGAMTGQTFLRFAAFDLLVHSWDLATAVDATLDVPPDLVAQIDDFARHVLDDWPRDGINFAAASSPSADAAPLDRLVAYTGRRL